MIRKAVKATLELGVFDGLLYGLSQTLSRLGADIEIHRHELMAQPVSSAPLLRPNRGRTLSVREISPGDPAIGTMPLTKEVVEFRFAQNCVCLGAFKGDALVAYLWLCFGAYEEDVVRCRFVPSPASNTVWDFDVYVFPRYRVGLAFARLWDETQSYLRAHGISWTYSRISPFNQQSLNAHRRLAAQCVGRALFLRRGGAQIMVATIHPYLHVSGRSGCGPELRISPPKSAAARGRRPEGAQLSDG